MKSILIEGGIIFLSNKKHMTEMKNILSVSFIVFEIVGFWKPITWQSPWLNYLYKFRTSFSFLMLYSFAVTGIIGLINTHDNVEQVTNDCFILLSLIAVCGKTVNVVRSRQRIIQILKAFQSYPCAPINKEETCIQNEIDRFIWYYTVSYLVLTEVTALMVTFGTYYQNIPIGQLPYNTYIPWDHSEGFLYWLAYNYQLVTIMLSANVAIAYDTLVPSMMLQLRAKLDILKHRFNNFATLLESTLSTISNNDESYNMMKLKIERKLVANYTKFHILIFKLANAINSTFNFIIFFQCSISTIVICVSVYNLANIELFTAEFTGLILYLCCMLTEVFILYAAGNEVTLVSGSVGDAIYAMDWRNLNPSTMKSLIIIMSRTLHPIIFTSGHVITLSLDSFKSLIKISYSTYNVLQQTS